MLDWQYTLDKVGNVTGITDTLPANNKSFAYQDYQYFLTTGNGPWGTRSWSYDKIGNRLTETRGATTDTYVYTLNVAGGRSPKLDKINLGLGGVKDVTADAAGNETQVNVAGNVIDRTYDAVGRLTSQARGAAQTSSTFLYDGRGFLRSASGSSPATAGTAIFCDGFESGTIAARGGAGSSCFEEKRVEPTYDSNGLLQSIRRDSKSQHVLYFAGRPVALFEEELAIADPDPEEVELATIFLSLRYLTTDHLGTPILMTGSTGTSLWSGGFEPFGADWNGAQTAGLSLRFPGQWDDPSWSASGLGNPLSYNVFRWYSNTTARYEQPDPIKLRGGFNLYLYGRSSATRWFDSLGLDPNLPPVDRDGRDPFVQPFDLRFPSGPWGDRPSRGCCDKKEIAKGLEGADQNLRTMLGGQLLEGNPAGALYRGSFCRADGWCQPDLPGPNIAFDPYISPDITDPCSRFCTRVHEWFHRTDTRYHHTSWDEAKKERYREEPAYVLEKACLRSF